MTSTAVYLCRTPDGWQAYRAPDGRTREAFGPAFARLEAALDFADRAEGKPSRLSPLRSPVRDLTGDASPHVGRSGSEPGTVARPIATDDRPSR